MKKQQASRFHAHAANRNAELRGFPWNHRNLKSSQTILGAAAPQQSVIVAAAKAVSSGIGAAGCAQKLCLSNSPAALFGTMPNYAPLALGAVLAAALFAWIQKVLWTPSRTYNKEQNSVGREYDAWTEEGILEYYWGEHIHLGYYSDEERAKGYLRKNFIQAKYDFIDRMAEFGKINDGNGGAGNAATAPVSVLDVGCGIGGTSRYIAKKLGPQASVTGITLSPNQVKRATQLAEEKGISNAKFQVMDALAMTFPDNSFDIVWACESGEHMPDKKKYVEEMARVLKPGGRIVIATWCQRDEGNVPFSKDERRMLDFLYSEWTHPYFISISDYARLMTDTKVLHQITTADWAKQTIPSWRHSIWVGVFDPWPVFIRPKIWWKTIRDAVTLERMHRAFTDGLMQYGMMTASKRMTPSSAPPAVSPSS